MKPRMILTDLDGTLLRDDKSVSPAALAALRKVKSEAKTSQKTPILSVTLAVAADRSEYAEAIEAVHADLTEAAKVTGPFTVEQAAPAADSAEGASPVAVTAAELGEAPAKKK